MPLPYFNLGSILGPSLLDRLERNSTISWFPFEKRRSSRPCAIETRSNANTRVAINARQGKRLNVPSGDRHRAPLQRDDGTSRPVPGCERMRPPGHRMQMQGTRVQKQGSSDWTRGEIDFPDKNVTDSDPLAGGKPFLSFSSQVVCKATGSPKTLAAVDQWVTHVPHERQHHRSEVGRNRARTGRPNTWCKIPKGVDEFYGEKKKVANRKHR